MPGIGDQPKLSMYENIIKKPGTVYDNRKI